jgi:lipopolysaccharide/colanic/teichoic acid biosynthesis glycosyltransferase
VARRMILEEYLENPETSPRPTWKPRPPNPLAAVASAPACAADGDEAVAALLRIEEPADGMAYALPGQMWVDFRTREITIDLRGAAARRRISLARTRNDRVKRMLDVVVVAAAVPLWLPLLAVLAFAVKCTSRGPAFYAQERLGRGGRALLCVKLRTMAVDADVHLEHLLSTDAALRDEFADTFKLRRDPRVTPFGRLLRRTGLDELPQLIAILRGHMSLVGPRPIVSREARYYGLYLPLLQSVRPGLTGLWQVSGRNDVPYPARVAHDVQYVLTRSLWSDLKLIAKTAVLVFRPARRGSY